MAQIAQLTVSNMLLSILVILKMWLKVPAIKVYIALTLMCLQVCRRFYDTHFVSVYGKNVKINLAQYLVGLIHYPGSALAIVCEAPKFTNTGRF